MVAAAGVLLWLVVDLRIAPRRECAVRRKRAASLRLELSRSGRRSHQLHGLGR
jgi:hypothetical protein